MSHEEDALLKRLRPSRKRLVAGDLFVMHLTEGAFVFGRVVNPESEWTTVDDAGHAVLIYIYAFRSTSKDVPSREYLTIENLLVPPILTNRLGWSRGYFETIGNIPSGGEFDIRSRHCFDGRPASRDFYDERAQVVSDPFEPIGHWWLTSYEGIALEVAEAIDTQGI